LRSVDWAEPNDVGRRLILDDAHAFIPALTTDCDVVERNDNNKEREAQRAAQDEIQRKSLETLQTRIAKISQQSPAKDQRTTNQKSTGAGSGESGRMSSNNEELLQHLDRLKVVVMQQHSPKGVSSSQRSPLLQLESGNIMHHRISKGPAKFHGHEKSSSSKSHSATGTKKKLVSKGTGRSAHLEDECTRIIHSIPRTPAKAKKKVKGKVRAAVLGSKQPATMKSSKTHRATASHKRSSVK